MRDGKTLRKEHRGFHPKARSCSSRGMSLGTISSGIYLKRYGKIDFYLVIDVESTCDNKGTVPRGESEIIEIGACLVDSSDHAMVDEVCTFIKPVRHTTLTTFCKELTSIQQSDVDEAPSFPEAIASLKEFIGDRNVLFCSWGDYDRRKFLEDAKFHGNIELPYGKNHYNLKQSFFDKHQDSLGLRRPVGMDEALHLKELELEGTHHRGIDDARNTCQLLPHLFKAASHKRREDDSYEEEIRPKQPWEMEATDSSVW